jgi:hypothetical protein
MAYSQNPHCQPSPHPHINAIVKLAAAHNSNSLKPTCFSRIYIQKSRGRENSSAKTFVFEVTENTQRGETESIAGE